MMSVLLASLLLLEQVGELVPPRLLDGKLPGLAPLASNGGVAGLELHITATGIVQEAVVIDDAPPFTEEMRKVIRLWRFDPARRNGERVASKIAVVGVFRAPTLMALDPPPPTRMGAPSREIPYPIETATPDYPPKALYEGVVMMEVEIDALGAIANVEMLNEGDGFSAPALEAVRKFRFSPAPGYVLVVFGFPQPLTPRKTPR